jgi:hypothetical protein
MRHDVDVTLGSRHRFVDYFVPDRAAAVVNEYRRSPGQRIVRVLRDPSLSAYSQISGGFGFR